MRSKSEELMLRIREYIESYFERYSSTPTVREIATSYEDRGFLRTQIPCSNGGEGYGFLRKRYALHAEDPADESGGEPRRHCWLHPLRLA